jgi:hypothetical protein
MIHNQAWASQGDVFSEVPNGQVILTTGGQLRLPILQTNPAILLTFDCVLDKPNRDQSPRIKRLHFLPLCLVSEQDPNLQRALRRATTTPYEFFYLGECGALGEVFAPLSEGYSLPAAYFEVKLEPFDREPPGSDGELRLTFGAHDTRIGLVEPEKREVLKDKMNAFWTQRLPPNAGATS